MTTLIAKDIKAIEIFGQLKYFSNSQDNDCKNPMKIPIRGANRAILLNLGWINGHLGKIV